MSDDDRQNARRKALQAARAVTLGLAIATTAAGCEQVIDRACGFAENTRYCCERRHFMWDSSASVCRPPLPVPGPFTPPDLPA
ncbi:hypothetical protein [Sandaracinus amylolyticus]|uniref:hypothetical protein n=1 Tax=Sandaracinus amylolyticus TaxID=927083 RepID=UPI001F47DB4D|nr:hypothetical protein [Sandaracinus amylolyticus]UJR85269.1 Hypothetical protein I5071_73490 [Sandaracinus amylolyticus]